MQALKNIYPNITIDDFYAAMAWAGLNGTVNGDITKAWETFQANYPDKANMYNVIIAAEENDTNLSATKEKC